VKVTADTITDDQIRSMHDGAQPVSDDLHEVCRIALYAPIGSLRRVQARAKCADILNGEAGLP
jgi:hypothetical protein